VDFKLKEVMEAIGPSAALAFAAWLFLQLLQQRYSAAYTRYRDMIDAMRNGADGKRRDAMTEEVGIYHQRVVYMLHATNIGMVAAIMLLLSLVTNGLDAVFKLDWLKYIGAPLVLLGLLLVIPAAILVIRENLLIKKPIEAELADLGEFNGEDAAREKGQRKQQH